ncbi:SPFH domain-containing protein [Candidatus Uabimicrobium sp. HlEnr_7]|uniref:SPFH domain-containing protein n=1 Tax=Candidatus Uabimicrobium helgolandensis TaxID=3095367 RepID=UPI003557CED5
MEIYYIAFAVVAVVVFSTCVIVVRQKTAQVIEVFGKFDSTRSAGLQFKMPWPIALSVGTINLKIQEVKDEVGVKTSDNAFIRFPVAVQFKVIEDKVQAAFYELDRPIQQIQSFVLNIIRSKAAGMTMADLYTSRDDIAVAVEHDLKGKLESFGYEIVTVLVDEPEPSKEVADAFNRVIAAKREQEAAIAEAEALKIRKVGEARANAESLKLTAQAYVEQRKTIAEGIGDAMGEIRDGLQGVNDQVILEYFAGIDERDAIRDAAKGKGSIIVFTNSKSTSDDQIALTKALMSQIKDNKTSK